MIDNGAIIMLIFCPQTNLDAKPRFYFDKNKTYLISGGLGGLGRSIARWMVSRGAKNLILLSRSGPRNEKAADLLETIKAEGARVEVPECDVTDAFELKSVLENCAKFMPPVAGCIQASMVLRVSPLRLSIFRRPTKYKARMHCLRTCCTKIGEQVLNQKYTARGTCTHSFQKTWIFSSCCHPSAASQDKADKPTTRPETRIKMHWRITVLRWEKKPFQSTLASWYQTVSWPKTSRSCIAC